MKYLSLAFVVLFALLPGIAAAQAATPAPDAPPDSAECVVAPLPPGAFDVLVALADPTPISTASGAMPEGPAVDAETDTLVRATIRQLAACINANDQPRELALYTYRYILQELAGTDAEIAAGTYGDDNITQPLVAAERADIVVDGKIVRLGDGRVAALVTFVDGDGTTEDGQAVMTFAFEGGFWKVDDMVTLAGEATPAAS